MKELTIEQKAKAYDEALERAKKELQICGSSDCDAARQIFRFFPELKENEDERIRKEIIAFLHSKNGYMTPNEDWDFHNRWIAWLEKQGEQKSFARYKVGDTIYYNSFGRLVSFTIANIVEDGTNNPMYEDKDGNSVFQNDIVEQNPTDNIEPKFKVGDWVVNKFGDVWHIDSFDKKNYQVSNGDKYNYFPISKQNEMHLWTIQDAKDGDVLVIQKTNVTYESIFIFNKIENNYIIQYLHYFTTDTGEEVCEARSIDGFLGFVGTTVHPATKEQRNTLMKAMADAGLEFDFEKKELKKIEQNPVIGMKTPEESLGVDSDTYNKIVDECVYGEQNPAEWNEEDETILKAIILNLEKFKKYCAIPSTQYVSKCINWLKSLKPQNIWRPSLSQLNALGVVAKGNAPDDIEEINSLYKDLKKLRRNSYE